MKFFVFLVASGPCHNVLSLRERVKFVLWFLIGFGPLSEPVYFMKTPEFVFLIGFWALVRMVLVCENV